MVDTSTTSTKEIFHSVFPALMLGLFGLFSFALFAQVFSSAGGAGFFANVGDVATFGFFVGVDNVVIGYLLFDVGIVVVEGD